MRFLKSVISVFAINNFYTIWIWAIIKCTNQRILHKISCITCLNKWQLFLVFFLQMVAKFHNLALRKWWIKNLDGNYHRKEQFNQKNRRRKCGSMCVVFLYYFSLLPICHRFKFKSYKVKNKAWFLLAQIWSNGNYCI